MQHIVHTHNYSTARTDAYQDICQHTYTYNHNHCLDRKQSNSYMFAAWSPSSQQLRQTTYTTHD